MKKYIVLSFLLAISAGSSAHAQVVRNVWLPVDTLIAGDTIAFPSVDTGYIALPGKLYVTTDGGKTFTSKPIPQTGTDFLQQMCWPTTQNGYLLFATNSTSGNSFQLEVTSNGGNGWTMINLASFPIAHISFPTPNIGYATGELNPVGTGYFVAKTTNAGTTWTEVTESSSTLGPILFKTPEEGMYVYYSTAGVPQITYTFDGLKTMKNAALIPFGTQAQSENFLAWNDDGSWIVQYEGIVRSSDSGKNWKPVLADDASGTYGKIASACFHGARGFAFAENAADFETTDYGASWHSFTSTHQDITGVGTTCAMPSDTVAYTTALGNNMELLKLFLPPSAGVAQTPVSQSGLLNVAQRGASLLFTTNPEANERSIQIYDMLGRELTSIPLGAMNTSATLASGMLIPGSYFARLGSAMVKFAVW